MALEMQGRSTDGYAMDWLWLGLYHALAMLWATFWALVLGFTISGVLQIFVSKEQISRAFGQTNLKSVSLATGKLLKYKFVSGPRIKCAKTHIATTSTRLRLGSARRASMSMSSPR